MDPCIMTDESQALIPLQERQVPFYGDQVLAVLVDVEGEPQVYVPLRPICGYLGLAWNGQRERIMRDPVLSEAVQFVRVTRTNAGDPHMLALPLKFLPGWLFGVNAARVKEELRPKIIRYQRECFDVLWRAFQADTLTRAAQTRPGSLADIRAMGLAIAALAEQQMALESRVDAHDQRLDRAAEVVRALDRRVTAIESTAGPRALISEEQAAEISAAVKALAQQLAAKDPSKNHYQSVFAELYRRFGVSSYKNIARGQFVAVMEFLESWRAMGQLEGEEYG
jgi:hypothetical protein